jgi:hypothetical protein
MTVVVQAFQHPVSDIYMLLNRALVGYPKGGKERIMGLWHTRQERPCALSAAAARTCAQSANSST